MQSLILLVMAACDIRYTLRLKHFIALEFSPSLA